jgi:hypothetical protein
MSAITVPLSMPSTPVVARVFPSPSAPISLWEDVQSIVYEPSYPPGWLDGADLQPFDATWDPAVPTIRCVSDPSCPVLAVADWPQVVPGTLPAFSEKMVVSSSADAEVEESFVNAAASASTACLTTTPGRSITAAAASPAFISLLAAIPLSRHAGSPNQAPLLDSFDTTSLLESLRFALADAEKGRDHPNQYYAQRRPLADHSGVMRTASLALYACISEATDALVGVLSGRRSGMRWRLPALSWMMKTPFSCELHLRLIAMVSGYGRSTMDTQVRFTDWMP